MQRRQWFKLHSWAGLQCSMFLCFVLVTGTLATVSRDLDWLFNPAMRATDSIGSSDVSQTNWPAMLDHAKAAFPGATLVSLEASPDTWFNAETVAINGDGERFRIFHDRASGAVTGTGRWFNWQRFFRQIHRHLMMPVQLGATLVCLMLIPLLVSLVSSLYVYRHWYRKWFQLPRLTVPAHPGRRSAPTRNRKRRRVWGELHKFVGIWSLWFILLMVATSLWYLAELWGLDATYPAEAPAGYRAQADTATPGGEGLAAMLARGRATYPGLEVRSVLLPSEARPWLTLRGQAGAVLVRDRANQVTLAPGSGELLSLRRGTQLGVHSRISEAADPLHFGTWGNGPTRWLWFLFGALLSGLAISGVYLRAMRAISGHESGARLSFWRRSWTGMGWARWPATGLIGAGLLLAVLIFVPGY